MPTDRPTNLPAEVTTSQFKAFVDGYVETMLYSTNDESDESGGQPLSDNYSASDLAPSARRDVEATCARFIEHTYRLLSVAVERPGYGWNNAGGDLWYTSGGHGVGFWDRDALEDDGLGDALTGRCQHKEKHVYVGDDGKIYHEGTDHNYRTEAQRVEDETLALREALAQTPTPVVTSAPGRARL